MSNVRQYKAGAKRLPPICSEWRFNELASPIRDGHTHNNLTVSGGGFSATNGTTIDQSVGAYWVDAGTPFIEGNDKFMMFLEFTPQTTAGDSDFIAVGSGTGFNTTDYTWYASMAPTLDGFYFGVVPSTNGSYGAGVSITTGAVATSVKHYTMFGYQKRGAAGTNLAFMYLWRDGDAQILTANSSTMDDIKTGTGHKLATRGDLTGTSFSAVYGHMAYMKSYYVENKALFRRLIKRAKGEM